MATITQTGPEKWRAQVRRTGQPTMAKTFTGKKSEAEARTWAASIESGLDAGKKLGIHGRTGVTVAETVQRYIEEKGDVNKSSLTALNHFSDMCGKLMLSKLNDDHIFNYIKSKNFSAAAGSFHFYTIQAMLKRASLMWKYHVPEIMAHARARLVFDGLIGKSKARERRPTLEEVEALKAFEWPGTLPMPDIIDFAISSSMRRAEITRISWDTYKKSDSAGVSSTVLITDRKHPSLKLGNDQTVPLLQEAVLIIERQPKVEGDSRIFPFDPEYIGSLFSDACKALGIDDLHFHDLRHEGASRLFERGYQIHEVALFTGHTDWKMLRRYTHLKAKDLRQIEAPKAQPVQAAPEGVVMDAETLKQFKMFQAMMATMNKSPETA